MRAVRPAADHRDHVEAHHRPVLVLVLDQPARRQPAQPGRLRRHHRLGRIAEGTRAAGLHLDEDERVVLAGDHVDLPLRAAPVAREHGQPLVDEVLDRALLPEPPDGVLDPHAPSQAVAEIGRAWVPAGHVDDTRCVCTVDLTAAAWVFSIKLIDILGGGMALPDFLVIGAPKAGSTAVHEALVQHPQLFLSTPKEPKFFLTGGVRPRRVAAPRARRRAQRARVGVVAARSTSSCSTPRRPARCAARARRSTCGAGPRTSASVQTVPDAKLIAVIRDPVDRAYSNWTHLRCDGLEPEADFVTACRKEPDRASPRGSRRSGAISSSAGTASSSSTCSGSSPASRCTCCATRSSSTSRRAPSTRSASSSASRPAWSTPSRTRTRPAGPTTAGQQRAARRRPRRCRGRLAVPAAGVAARRTLRSSARYAATTSNRPHLEVGAAPRTRRSLPRGHRAARVAARPLVSRLDERLRARHVRGAQVVSAVDA